MVCHYDGFIMVRGEGVGYYLLSSSLIVLKPPTDVCSPERMGQSRATAAHSPHRLQSGTD